MEEARMQTSLTGDDTRDALARLTRANRACAQAYPGDRADRQPVHTVYGGAHLFTGGLARKLGEAALQSLAEHAPDPASFARAIGLPETLAPTVYARVVEKLKREPVEDHRLDFEDGYGNRPDAEEDGHAVTAAVEVAAGMAQGSLPPFIGIRIKPLTEELRARSLRTLDLFLTALLARSGGALPQGFVVTLPKVTVPEQVTALVVVLEALERRLSLPSGALPIELMVETPQSLFGPRGELALPAQVAAARGRCRGAHFGIYDYTASLNITAMHQVPSHHACHFARLAMQVALAGTGVTLSDGATTVMPVGPHRAPDRGPPLAREQLAENRRAVHHGWRTHYDDVRASLRQAYYQGWDLHPAQLPTRYAGVFALFLEAREEASVRLRSFVEKAAQATLVGNIFDDAATGQGLLNFFLRGINCGALTEAEALATGLTLEELRGRSFVKILDARRARAGA
jgi:citrate lyase beta subunit